MTLSAAEVIDRLAKTMRAEIAPAVDAAYPKTQAFMASVVLEKLARQLAGAAERERADAADLAALYADLDGLLPADACPAAVLAGVVAGLEQPDTAGLCRLIELLYAHRDNVAFDTALQRIRTTLRARVDRQMDYAR